MRPLLAALSLVLGSAEAGKFVHARVNEHCNDACSGNGECQAAPATSDWVAWANANTAAAFAEVGFACTSIYTDSGGIYSATSSPGSCYKMNSTATFSCTGKSSGRRRLCWCGLTSSWAEPGDRLPPPLPPSARPPPPKPQPPPPKAPAAMAASNVAFYAALFFSGVLLMSGIVLCNTRPVPSSQTVATLVGGAQSPGGAMAA